MLFVFLAGQLLLPYGDVSYADQIPEMIRTFIALNGTDEADDFFEEQFINIDHFFGDDDDDDSEEEHIPVSFHPPTIIVVACLSHPQTHEFSPAAHSDYMPLCFIHYSNNFTHSIFHPPRFV